MSRAAVSFSRQALAVGRQVTQKRPEKVGARPNSRGRQAAARTGRALMHLRSCARHQKPDRGLRRE